MPGNTTVNHDQSSDAADPLRRHNIRLLESMLGHLGRKEFKETGRYLAEDVYCDWPFLPIPEMPEVITGRRQILEFFREGMKDFAPYDYRITAIFELKDPNQLIAEYHSNSVYHVNSRPYSNRYLGIFRFADDQITYWREYINPETIRQVLLDL